MRDRPMATSDSIGRFRCPGVPGGSCTVSARTADAVSSESELIPALIERLGEGDLPVRIVIIQFLGVIRSAESVLPLLEAGRDEALAELVAIQRARSG